MSHIHSDRCQRTAVKLCCAQVDAQHQGQEGQHGSQGIFPGPVSGQDAQNEKSVYKHQPANQEWIGIRVERVVGNGDGQVHRQQKQLAQGPADISQNSGGGQPNKARQHRQKAGHEITGGQGDTHQACQRRHCGKYAEIVGRQRYGEDHSPQGGGECTGQKSACLGRKPCPGLLPCPEEPVDPGRDQDQPQHGAKAELQAHAGCGIGVDQQNESQSRRQGGDGIGIPLEQGRQQQEKLHDTRPNHRGRQPHHKHIKYQHCRAHCRQKPPPMPYKQTQQRQQKGAVQPGNGKQVAHTRLGKADGQFFGDAAALSQKLRLQETGHSAVTLPYPGDFVPEGLFHPLGQIPQGAGLTLGHRGHLLAVQQDKDTPGGEGGQLCALDNGGILPVGASQKGLPRLQKGGRFIAEIARGLGTPGICQAHRDPPARIPLLRPITHRGGKQMAAAALILHRLRHQGAPATAIQQPRRQG